MQTPRVSICIPTVDRLPYLRESVASAQAQSLRALEILIGDDGDSDELRVWALDAAAADRRVRYLKTPRRLGLAGNWNFLADSAAGEFLTIIGDDDRLLPEFAERLLRETTNEVAVVFSNHYVIDGTGRRLIDASHDSTRQYGRDALSPGVLANATQAVWRNSVPMSASIVRTSAVRRLRFRPDINTPEIELFARLSLEGPAFVFVPEYLAEYRSHAGSETARGLTLDRLAEYLEPIDVPADVEPAKRDCLAQVLAAGVGIRLARGDIAGARRLCHSRYYARRPHIVRAAGQPESAGRARRADVRRASPRRPARARYRATGQERADGLQRGQRARPRSHSARRSPCARRRMRRRRARPRDQGATSNGGRRRDALRARRPSARAQVLDEVVSADLESADLTHLGAFDCIVCSHVLEHVREPARTPRAPARQPRGRRDCAHRPAQHLALPAASRVPRGPVPIHRRRTHGPHPLPVLRLGHGPRPGAGGGPSARGGTRRRWLSGSRFLGPLRGLLDRLAVGSFPGAFGVQFVLTARRDDR